MKENQMKVELLPHTSFLKENGQFDKETAIEYCAKLGGECYEKEGWTKLKNESKEKTENRINLTLKMEHQTIYEHVHIGFEIVNIPKILAMVLNNERQNTTSEKSARYTPIDANIDPNISAKEGELYNKWMNIFRIIIKDKYGYIHNDSKIEKLAQENARYLVTVFASTRMIHTVPWIQLNRIVSFMLDFMKKENKTAFEERLSESFSEFINCFVELNVLDDRAMSNRKKRKLSLFKDGKVEEHFGDTYSTNYKGSLVQLAQAHRHRTLKYNMSFLDEKEYFIPPILLDNYELVAEWLNDISSVAYAYPQGELVSINEVGDLDAFIQKTKERLCSAAQLEIMMQTKNTLLKYKNALEEKNHPRASDIATHSKGARCTFPDYTCIQDCKFKEGKRLVRKI